ncbi:MAG: MerR family transcriptional regulator [Carbonactinosporaceae bacterium]
MDLIPIGEAARMLGVNTSALRYYEERGLVHPPARRGGRRMYGQAELRRIALIRIAHQLGLGLDTAAAVLDAPSERWREVVRDQDAALEALIARAEGARKFLAHALSCPSEHPARECPYLIGTLDRLVGGATLEQIAAEHT